MLEYDSDLRQFSTFWFLPVATRGVCVAALLADLLPRPCDLLATAAAYTALRARH